MNSDLFPETLLVECRDGHVYTTSLKIAEYFGKQHKNVSTLIRKIIETSPDAEQRLNFKPLCDTYRVENGAKRQREIFHLTHDGFSIVAMSFTGEKALAWKWKFLAAFRNMERQLAILKEREAAALYAIRPRWKPIVEHPDLPRAGLIQLTGHKSPGSITACRRRMRAVGLIGEAQS